MKIILSHDVDHLYWKEHYFRDLSAQKYLIRHGLAFVKKQIDFNILKNRLNIFGRIHRIPELLDFHDKNNTKACFFFGMEHALGLIYKPSEAAPWIKKISEKGFEVGVHGIAYADKAQIEKEFQTFHRISGLQSFGIRNHYLRMNGYTLEMLSQQGYQFDSTIQGILHPFQINGMWEIPMSMMDASLVPNAQSNMNLETWKNAALLRLDDAQEKEIPYFVVNLHDPYFDEKLFPTTFKWYHWLIEEFKNRGLEFITFGQAVNELNKMQGN